MHAYSTHTMGNALKRQGQKVNRLSQRVSEEHSAQRNDRLVSFV